MKLEEISSVYVIKQMLAEMAKFQVTDTSNMDPLAAFDLISKQFAAARRALGITNKLKNPEERQKYKSRTLGAMNSIRAALRRLEKQIQGNSEFAIAEGIKFMNQLLTEWDSGYDYDRAHAYMDARSDAEDARLQDRFHDDVSSNFFTLAELAGPRKDPFLSQLFFFLDEHDTEDFSGYYEYEPGTTDYVTAIKNAFMPAIESIRNAGQGETSPDELYVDVGEWHRFIKQHSAALSAHRPPITALAAAASDFAQSIEVFNNDDVEAWFHE